MTVTTAPAPTTAAPAAPAEAAPVRAPDGKFAPKPAAPAPEPAAKKDPPAAAADKPIEPAAKPISPQLAAIAKKERELQAEKEKLKAERAELDGWRKEKAELDAVRKEAKLNPLAFMKASGLSFEEVQDFVLKGQVPPEVKAKHELDTVREQVEALRKEREEEAKKLQASATEKAKADWRSKLAETAKAGAEKYELVNAMGDEALELAQEAFEAAYEKDGTVLSLDKLLEQAELYYESKTAKLLTSQKLRAKLQPVVEVPKPVAPKAASESGPRRAVRTLTNSTAAPAAPKSGRPTTLEDRIEAAASALRAAKRG
jgi:hypothetical protein